MLRNFWRDTKEHLDFWNPDESGSATFQTSTLRIDQNAFDFQRPDVLQALVVPTTLPTPAHGIQSDALGSSTFPPVFELWSLDGTNGFKIIGVAAGDWSGRSVASAGDINGDGFDDLIIGSFKAAPHGSSSGTSYVVFGKASGFTASLDLSNLVSSNGFKINGEGIGDFSGYSVASAGDFNGDGFDDLIIGAYGSDPNGNSSGTSYVVFGKASGFTAVLELSSLNGSNGFQINGEGIGDFSGWSVSSAGDFNGDGFDDLIIGAWGADPNVNYSGASYVVFGKASGFTATLELSSLDGSNGFQINGEAFRDYSGRSVSSAGDVNGDGFDDLIVGAMGADPNGSFSGASYVIFGHPTGASRGGDILNEAISWIGRPSAPVWGKANCTGFVYTVAHDVGQTFFDTSAAAVTKTGPYGAMGPPNLLNNALSV